MDVKREEEEPRPAPMPKRKRGKVQKVDTRNLERGGASWRKQLGANVRGMRESFGITRLQLASRLCWPVSTLTKLEAGELTPSAGQEADLARWVQRTSSK